VAALFVALIHYPVTDRNGRVVTSAVTSLDLHDIARSSRTYGVSAFFVVHPIPEQRTFAASVIDHWQTGYGRQFDSRRREALDLIRIVTDLDEAIVEAERIAGARPSIVYTSARAPIAAETASSPPPIEQSRQSTPIASPAIIDASASASWIETVRPSGDGDTIPSPTSSQSSPMRAPNAALISYAGMRARLERPDAAPVILLFGTGFGMTPALLERADLVLPPVFGPGAYNHLSVRAAAGIILDRLRGH
jgi:hypothetical protein